MPKEDLAPNQAKTEFVAPTRKGITEGLVATIDNYKSKCTNAKYKKEKLEFLQTAITAAVLAENLKDEDGILFFSLKDVLDEIIKVYENNAQNISDDNLKSRILGLIDELRKTDKTKTFKYSSSEGTVMSYLQNVLRETTAGNSANGFHAYSNTRYPVLPSEQLYWIGPIATVERDNYWAHQRQKNANRQLKHAQGY